VAGRWEAARSDEAEQKYEARPAHPKRRRTRRPLHSPHFTAKPSGIEPARHENGTAAPDIESDDAFSDGFERSHRDHAFEDFAEFDAQGSEPSTVYPDEVPPGDSEVDSDAEVSGLDVDEILRKLHRQGADSLTEPEREILMSASRQLNDRRQRP
ncbi:MAG TPA: hypothetical protein DDW52_20180, partial [Planctomycetaceae bacterium]|nr:hypothetical protein [Planctomycetaceae bacterium]